MWEAAAWIGDASLRIWKVVPSWDSNKCVGPICHCLMRKNSSYNLRLRREPIGLSDIVFIDMSQLILHNLY